MNTIFLTRKRLLDGVHKAASRVVADFDDVRDIFHQVQKPG